MDSVARSGDDAAADSEHRSHCEKEPQQVKQGERRNKRGPNHKRFSDPRDLVHVFLIFFDPRGLGIPIFLRLLREANKPELDLIRIEESLKREPALVYKLLRYLNSAAFAWERPIDSIRHALALLGTDQIRKWIGLLALAALTDRSPAALCPAAIIRARFCELIAAKAGFETRSSELFLFGMLSLFEAILRRPTQEIIEHIDLNQDIRNALLNQAQAGDTIGTIYSLVTGYEAGAWDTVDQCAKGLGVSRPALSTAYTDAVSWAEDLGMV